MPDTFTFIQPVLDLGHLIAVQSELSRPQSIHHMGDERFAASCLRRGVSLFDGAIARRDFDPHNAKAAGHELIRNCIARVPGGAFQIANIGDGGGIWDPDAGGQLPPYLIQVESMHLAAANFVMSKAQVRDRAMVLTTSLARFSACYGRVINELLIVQGKRGARIVATEITCFNECRLTHDGDGVVVFETFGRRLKLFDLTEGGGLSKQCVLVQFELGDFFNGCRFVCVGHLRSTLIVSNGLSCISPQGEAALVLAYIDPAHVDWVETALSAGRMGREHYYETDDTVLRNVASIEFSADGRTAWLGSLAGDTVTTFDISSITG